MLESGRCTDSRDCWQTFVDNSFAAKAFRLTVGSDRKPLDGLASYDIFVDPLNSSVEETHEIRYLKDVVFVADVMNVNELAVILAYIVVPSMKAEELRADTSASAVH